MDKIFKNILDFINEGIIYQEAGGKIIIWNKSAENIFNLSEQEAVGLTSTSHQWNLIYEDGTPCPGDQHPSMLTLKTGESHTNEIRGIQHAGGGITWLSINTRPIFEPGESKPSAVVISFLDVTDRISDRHDLREAENQYAMAAKMAKVGHWMRDFENDKAEWSPEVFNIFGLDPAQKAPNQNEFFEKIVHPEDRAHLLSSVQKALSEKKKLDCQYRIFRPNGEIRHIHAMAEIEEKEDSVPARLVGFLQDITDLSRAEDELQKSHALLNETQAITKVGGWELDIASGEVKWTDEVYRIYGVKPGRYDPRDISRDLSFYDPESLPILQEAFERALNQGIPYDLELKFIRADGERIWVRTSCKPISINGQVTRLAGNFMDITERKLLEEKLRDTLTLLENVYDSLDEVVLVVDPATRKIISCNSVAQTVFGYQPDEMIGKNTEFLHVNVGGRVNPARGGQVITGHIETL